MGEDLDVDNSMCFICGFRPVKLDKCVLGGINIYVCSNRCLGITLRVHDEEDESGESLLVATVVQAELMGVHPSSLVYDFGQIADYVRGVYGIE